MRLPSIPVDWIFPTPFSRASEVQKLLAARVATEDLFSLPLENVAGADVSNYVSDPGHVFATCVLLAWPSLKLVDWSSTWGSQSLPYRPGFLGFREVPQLLMTLQEMAQAPQLLFVDGHGVAHPRGLGIASHLGVLMDLPTIGVAKSLLCGRLEREMGGHVGDCVPVLWKGRTIAMAVRTRKRANPVYVSSGHRVSLKTAVELVLQSLTGYRLPEPTRQAHLLANAARVGPVNVGGEGSRIEPG